MCPPQPATARVSVFTRGVSVLIATTSAIDHARRRGWPADESVSVTLVTLLPPRIAINVIARLLPEARLVLVDEAQAPDPFGALPEIEMRHQEPRRSAMRGRERQALIMGRDQ